MKTVRRYTLFFLGAVIISGCSLKFGQRVTSSHYVYPNSNVTTLGPVNEYMTKMGILLPANVTKDDYENLFDTALSRHSGANIIIDMGVDVEYINYPLVWITKFSLTGTAAKMEIGKQELTQLRENAIEKLMLEQRTTTTK